MNLDDDLQQFLAAIKDKPNPYLRGLLASFAMVEGAVQSLLESRSPKNQPPRADRKLDAGDYCSIAELAMRWRCSRATVYNRLRQVGARVLDFSTKGKRGKKAIPASVVIQIENRQTKRLC